MIGLPSPTVSKTAGCDDQSLRSTLAGARAERAHRKDVATTFCAEPNANPAMLTKDILLETSRYNGRVVSSIGAPRKIRQASRDADAREDALKVNGTNFSLSD